MSQDPTTTAPTSCPSCGTPSDPSYDYCAFGCGIFWASLSPEAIARKEAHSTDIKARLARSDEWLTETARRLLDEKTTR